jgi:hypothetical protein
MTSSYNFCEVHPINCMCAPCTRPASSSCEATEQRHPELWRSCTARAPPEQYAGQHATEERTERVTAACHTLAAAFAQHAVMNAALQAVSRREAVAAPREAHAAIANACLNLAGPVARAVAVDPALAGAHESFDQCSAGLSARVADRVVPLLAATCQDMALASERT